MNLFVAMPFDGRFEKPFELAVKPAALAAGTQCVRIDKEFYVGDVVAAIKKAIRASSAVLADLSASNPNVLYEAGYAHALRKPVVQICSTTFKKLPFDVRNNNTLHYKASALDSLRRRLTKTLISAKPRWHTRSTKAA